MLRHEKIIGHVMIDKNDGQILAPKNIYYYVTTGYIKSSDLEVSQEVITYGVKLVEKDYMGVFINEFMINDVTLIETDIFFLVENLMKFKVTIIGLYDVINDYVS